MIEDRDLLTVTEERQLDTDAIHLRLRSRFFDYRGGMAFTAREAPDLELSSRFLLEAFTPLFRAYAAMPFSAQILRPLLEATMNRLLPEAHRRICLDFRLRSQTARLVSDHNPPILNFLIQGEVATEHMNRLEAAFEEMRRTGDGVVSLARAEHIPPEPMAALPHHEPINATQFRQHMLGIERALFWGEITSRRGFDREAVQRSRETLVHCLSPVQRAEFERTGKFSVVGEDGKLYQVLPVEAFNVEDETYRYCCVPAAPCPLYDKMLASKLWLEANIREFMALANRSYKDGRRSPPRIIYNDVEDRRRIQSWTNTLTGLY